MGRIPSFEQGPIRPPNEARSLLLRVTRNCPWNQCLFCPVYKKSKFSLRTVEEIKQDMKFVFVDTVDDVIKSALEAAKKTSPSKSNGKTQKAASRKTKGNGKDTTRRR